MDTFRIDQVFYLNLFITDLNGDPKTGLITSYTIYKASDDSVIVSGSLMDIGNGAYNASYIFTELGQFYIIYNTPSEYTNEIASILIESECAKSEELLRVLGLTGENKRILNTIYDSNQNLTYSYVKIYKNASDFVADINEIATYEMTATYSTNNEMQEMGVKRLT
ncbi:MAG TPA: hypothetical protein ENI61_06655 [Ignavibacteria bacterium]|nr:hypothetical protein [Ignavibacteria bacterium]